MGVAWVSAQYSASKTWKQCSGRHAAETTAAAVAVASAPAPTLAVVLALALVGGVPSPSLDVAAVVDASVACRTIYGNQQSGGVVVVR